MNGNTRVCPTCEESKAVEDFPIKMRHPDGSVRARQSCCRPCKTRRDDANHRKRRDWSIDGPWQPPAGTSPCGPQLELEPLRLWLLDTFHNVEKTTLANLLGMDDVHLGRILRGHQRQISLHIADRILIKAGRPDVLATLYPLDD